MNLKSVARDLWLLRTFKNGARFAAGLRTGRFPSEAIFRDGYVLRHPLHFTGLAEVLIEVLHEQVYTPSWFYVPRPNDILLDFGANVGVFAIGEVRRNPTARVVAVEAHPGVFRQLQSNIAPFARQIQIHHAAVQGSEGTAELGNPTSRSLDIRVSNESSEGTITVPAIDFSRAVSLVGDEGDIALLKCDIEGAEADVFESARVADLKKVRNIALEYHDNIQPGTSGRVWGVLEKTHRLLHLADDRGCGIMLWKRLDLVEA
jgi:FkbM family methyltransferase